MSETTPINCGVARVGYLGQHHARIYSALEQCELAGVYDANEARAAEIAAQYNCPVFPTLQALGEACEAVSVAVPTDKHCEVAIPLLQGGCHLLIEKPLCVTMQEAEQILSLAQERGRFVQVGHIEHYNPVMSFLEKQVHAPRYITADRLAPFNPRGMEVGVVLDLMIHDLGVILQLVDSPVKAVESVGVNVISQREDIANARITFENGCVANINTSRVSQKKVREIRVFQPNAYLSLDFMNQSGHILKKTGPMDISKEEIPIEKAEPLMVELASFAECVRKRQQPKVGGTLGKTALELALQITDQIAKGSL